MTIRVYFLNTLKEGVDKAEYERWIRERDYPYARALNSINSYDVTPISGALDGFGAEFSHDYLEVVEITSMEEYGAELGGAADFFEEWSQYVDQSKSSAVFGDVIE
jgi:hypothetical protein